MIHKSMTAALFACALTLVPEAAFASDKPVDSAITLEADGTRTLVHIAEFDAPVAEVWTALSSEEGWKGWGPKFALIDFRQGGSIESGYHAGATPGDPKNIRHRILAFVPERMIALKVEQAPAGGPVSAEILDKVWSVFELEPVEGDRTRLTIRGLGYPEGEEADRVIAFFEQGNAYSVELLRKYLAERGG